MKDQELVNALREHAEWAQGNEWETPITLGDDLVEAADRIANQNTHILALQKEIEGLRKQLPRWIPVTERMPERGVPVLGWYKDNPFSAYCPEVVAWNGSGWVFIYAHRYVTDVTHWMQLPEPPEVE